MMMSFNDFFKRYILKIKATSNIKTYQNLSSFGLDNVDLCLRDGPFSIDVGIVNLNHSNGTHWVVYINEFFFDSYGFSPPRNFSKFIMKRTRLCLYSEYKIQSLIGEGDSFCAKVCFYIIYVTKSFGNTF